ncbi:MAG: permease [Bacteroidota bacterium]
MNPAVQKTLSLVLLIVIGVLLKKKLQSREQLGGIKLLILSIALPATIFVALLKIQIEPSLLALPVLALGFNGVMLAATRALLPAFGIQAGTAVSRTLMMLLPSLAPGLTCFPFVMEYLGEEPLAWAALADVGNKVFVLILLYLLAMHWYHQRQRSAESGASRLQGLLVSLVSEPVNLVIVGALVLLGFGLNLEALPGFLQESFLRMSAMMTPMVLLFIGLAVTLTRQQVRLIAALLSARAGFSMLVSAALVALLGLTDPTAILLAVAFPLSACSFWPYAHMAAVEALEATGERAQGGTFDLNLALVVLAVSLPFSTVLILAVCSSGTLFADPWVLSGTGGALLLGGALPVVLGRLRGTPMALAEPVS